MFLVPYYTGKSSTAEFHVSSVLKTTGIQTSTPSTDVTDAGNGNREPRVTQFSTPVLSRGVSD